jgi:tetratricopeptide (TPR) repeat protein
MDFMKLFKRMYFFCGYKSKFAQKMPKCSFLSILFILLLQNCTAQEKEKNKSNISQEQQLQALHDAIAQKPSESRLYLQRAYILDSLQNYLDALQDVNKFLEKNPENIEAYHLRGRLKVKLDDASGAINDFNKIILLDNQNKEAYFQRALIRLQTGDKSGACKELEKAKQLQHQQANEYWQKICNR